MKQKLSLFFADKGLTKLLAFALILVLARADYRAMQNFFSDPSFELYASEQAIYALIFALGLEGLPTFLGMSLANMLDAVKLKNDDGKNAAVGAAVAGAGLLLVFFLAYQLRMIPIQVNGGAAAFAAGTFPDYPAQLFLVFAPIITSFVAFAASWYAFRTDHAGALKHKADICFEAFLKAQTKLTAVENELDDACATLWVSIADHKALPSRPKRHAVFRNEAHARVRAKLIENALTTYTLQLKRYNAEVEAHVSAYLMQLSERSSIPFAIQQISLKEISAHLSESQTQGTMWDLNHALPELETELIRLIDNGIIVKQTHVATGYPIERKNAS